MADKIEKLVADFVEVGTKMSPRNYVELENRGYTVFKAGDTKMERLNQRNKDFVIKNFDKEIWYIATPSWYAEHKKDIGEPDSKIFKELNALAVDAENKRR
jgi:hypothetical protein